MAAANPTVKIETLRELIAAGSVRSATLLGQRGGFAVLVSVGMQERTLANRAGSVRLYARLDTAAKDLRELGLAEFGVNVVNYQPGRLRPARPDRAAQMKQAHEAAAHDVWFRGKVRNTLERLDSGEESLLDHDATFAELRTYAGALDASQPPVPKG
jgi:hypothetical protein